MNEFQSRASKDGEHYRKVCCESLERFGIEVIECKGFRVVDCGVDVDIVARNQAGVIMLIECKGGYESGKKQGGFKSSDNLRKAIASAYCISRSETHTGAPYTPLIVMTTYLMAPHAMIFNQLRVVQTAIMADVIHDRDADRLKWWARVDWPTVQGHIADLPTVADVVYKNRFWKLPPPKQRKAAATQAVMFAAD